jgi:hypothetical protein
MTAAAFNDELLIRLARQPFEPLTIRLIDGRGWVIDSPDSLQLFACGAEHCFVDDQIHRFFGPEMIAVILAG